MNKKLTEWQERVVVEKKELDSKIARLAHFIHTDQYKAMERIDALLLIKQLNFMRRYSSTLGERIERFPK